MKKILSLLLVVLLCLGAMTACGSSSTNNYIWTNEEGVSFTSAALKWEDFDISSMYDENGQLIGIKGSDYVTLPEDYESIPYTQADVTPTDEEIDNYISQLMKNYSTTEEITDRVVKDGDKVNIDYVGTVDGVAFTGGDTKGNGTTVTAGSTNYIDDFLTQIIGHMPGETFDVIVTFPDEYDASTDADGNTVELAGKEAVFSTTINYIAGETTVPECTDEWVKETLGLDDVQALRNDMSSYYGAQKKYQFVTDYLVKNSTYGEIPQKLLDYNGAMLLYMQSQYSKQYGDVTLEQWLSLQGYSSPEACLDANAASVLDNARSMLVTQTLVELKGVQLSDEEIQSLLGSYYDQYLSTYGTNYTAMYANAARCFTDLTNSAVAAD